MLDAAMPVALRRYEAIDILDYCIRGLSQGWFIMEGGDLLGVMVTKVDQYPRRRGLTVFCLAGSRMSDWFGKAEEVLTEHARQMGCDHFECQGRKGWERVLSLEPRATLLVKDLTVNKEQKADGVANA